MMHQKIERLSFCLIFNAIFLSFASESPTYYSEYGQDKYLNENIFKNKRNGIFVDIGADDGILNSNTYFFEKELGWNGICIEPRDNAFKKLKNNRKCLCIKVAIAAQKGTRNFVNVLEKIETFSGFLNTTANQHWKRIKDKNAKWEIIKIKTHTLNKLCIQNNIKHIDYLSIDTEGSEEEIIRSIDFDQIIIDVIDVENNYGNLRIRQYLESKGYKFVDRLKIDDIYALQKNS